MEAPEAFDEAIGVGLVREVTGAGEDLQPTARHRGVRLVRLFYWNDPVGRTPDQQCRHALDQITPVEHGDHLPTDVHNGPKGAQKCSAGRAVRQCMVTFE